MSAHRKENVEKKSRVALKIALRPWRQHMMIDANDVNELNVKADFLLGGNGISGKILGELQ